MAEPTAKETEVTCEERRLFSCVQVPQEFLLVIPFGTSYFKTDLPEVNLPEAELLGLILWDVVIEDDHAAVFLRPISVTMPRLVRDTASRTASELMIPRYCLDIAEGLYPACVSSSTSETRIRLPFSISRPPQTRVSAARYLPISIRAILMFSLDASLTLIRNLINFLRLNRPFTS
jgi:hypothetical protein